MSLLEEVQAAVNGNSLVVNVDAVSKGHVRIQTSLLHSDGTSIDVFVNSVRREDGYLLTDFGQSLEMLMDAQVKPFE